ncbi:MAG TPA: restriction endonuclease [Mycobacterium sp.]|nr:restriction endonuclease [Mycobacterium sp.]
MAEAAVDVLRRRGAGRPMHYRDITEKAVEDALIAPRGLTPEASMLAAITVDISRREGAGEPPAFVSYGRGFYGLPPERVGSEIEEAIRRNNRDVRERLHAELREIEPQAFEDLIGRLLTALGFVDVEVTNYSRDGGVDVRGTLAVGGVTNVTTAIQVKRWAKNISGKTVRELRGGLTPHERGLIITTAGFTRDAQAEAQAVERAPIALVNGEKLVSLLVEHAIGVVRTEARILRLDPAALLGPGEDETAPPELEAGDEIEDTAAAETAPSNLPVPRGRRSSRHASGKNLSLWPLPGGRGNFVQTMWMMLTFVSEREPTLDEFIDWLIGTFDRVNSRKTAKGYIEMVRLAGLIEPRVDRLVLTSDAASYLASTDPDELYHTMCDNIAGFEDTLDRIRQEPATLSELTAYLNTLLGTQWDTDAQAGWRVQWLESFGKVERNGDRFVPRE